MCLYPDIITFSHLRWDFVFQRPQHLLSRLQSKRRVLFIEEPCFSENAAPHWERSSPKPHVLVCRPVTPVRAHGFHEDQMPFLRELMDQLIAEESICDHVAWFYTPMALPLLEHLDPEVVVYDCMDELSAFLNAPAELLERECELLRRADIVFTGGPSLYAAKKNRHPHVYCFPSSVDAKHFAQAKNGIEEAQEQVGLATPRLGYFGVIDERVDLALMDELALAHPEWQIAMVGPVVKIDPAGLPNRSNIHYFGQRNYADLAKFLRGWDVCLLPFALNEATKHISPTKTLEYMAAEKMIVSTMIKDVAEPYGQIVYLGDSQEDFISACERALKVDDEERARRTAGMRSVLENTSWDATVQAMEVLMIRAARQRQKENRATVVANRVWRKTPFGQHEKIATLAANGNGVAGKNGNGSRPWLKSLLRGFRNDQAAV